MFFYYFVYKTRRKKKKKQSEKYNIRYRKYNKCLSNVIKNLDYTHRKKTVIADESIDDRHMRQVADYTLIFV